MASIISFINMKGGVGKTTLCISMGEYLANFKNKRVLIIDVDPQFNATQSFIGKLDKIDTYLELVNKRNTIKRIFEVNTSLFSDSEEFGKDDIILKLYDNLDIIPGDINIMFENNTVDSSRIQKVKNFIGDNNLRDEYDYILIDCPPTISMYTESSIIASDYYLMPMRIDQYSILGTNSLLAVISRFAKDQRLNIKPLGVIYTHTDRNLSEKTKKIKSSIENEKGLSNLYFFSNQFYNVRNLQVGQQSNFASSYSNSKQYIDAICIEFEKRLSEMKD